MSIPYKVECLQKVMELNHQANYDWTDNMICFKEQGLLKHLPEAEQKLIDELIKQGEQAISSKNELLDE